MVSLFEETRNSSKNFTNYTIPSAENYVSFLTYKFCQQFLFSFWKLFKKTRVNIQNKYRKYKIYCCNGSSFYYHGVVNVMSTCV